MVESTVLTQVNTYRPYSIRRKGVVSRFFRQLLMVEIIRYLVAWIRYIYFAKILGRLKTYQNATDGVSENTISHNLRGLKDFAVVRSLQLIRPLAAIEAVDRDSDFLVIGPRSEGELLNVIAHDFSSHKVRGLDLISYSPWIDLGDMHAMPYPDNSWDVIMLCGVIPYSENPSQVAKEVIRVARNGAVVAINWDYNPLSNEQVSEQLGYLPGAKKRLKTVSELLSLFGNAVDAVYFCHDIALTRVNTLGNIAAIFSIKK